MKKALVALPDQAWGIIDRDLNGKLGSGHSDIIRAIVLVDSPCLSKRARIHGQGRKEARCLRRKRRREQKRLTFWMP
jgi:hypothetical protein